MSFARRGVTLVECLVAASLLLAVLAIVSAAFGSTVNSLSKVNARADYLQSFQILGSNFVRDTQASLPSALDWAPDFYACPSPQHPDGAQLTPLERDLIYQSYRIYYRIPGQREAWLRSIPLSTPTAAVVPLSQADLGWGVQGLAFYANRGKKLVTDLDRFEVRMDGASVVLRLEGTRQHKGRIAPERLDLSFVAYPRNSL